MKGLLIKDFKLILLQKNFLIITLIVALGVVLFNNNLIFPLGFASFIASLLAISTINYDELDNGYTFLFTLPITRKKYIFEKYLLGLLTGGSVWGIITILVIIINILKSTLVFFDLISSSLMMLSLMFIIQAIMFPFQIKFGSEAGRIAMLGAFGILTILFWGLVKVIKLIFDINLITLLNNLQTLDLKIFLTILIISSLLSLLISLNISLTIINNKEF